MMQVRELIVYKKPLISTIGRPHGTNWFSWHSLKLGLVLG